MQSSGDISMPTLSLNLDIGLPSTSLEIGIPSSNTNSNHSSNSSASDRFSPCLSRNSTILDSEHTLVSEVQYEYSRLPEQHDANSRKTSESSIIFEDLLMCDDHQLYKQFFCYDCVIEICSECVKHFHNEHYFYPGVSCRELFEQTDRARYIVRDNVIMIGRQINNLHYKKHLTATSIKTFFQRLRELVNSRELELLHDVGYIADCRVRILDQKLKEHQEALNSSSQLLETLAECYRNGNLDFVLQNCRYAKKHLEVLRGLQKSLPLQDEDVVFVAPDDNFLTAMKEMGHITCPSYVASYTCTVRGLANLNTNTNTSNSLFDNGATYNLFQRSVEPATRPRSPLPPVQSTIANETARIPMLPFIAQPIRNDTVPISPILPPDNNMNNMNMFPVSFHTRRNYARIKKPVTVFGKEGCGEYDLCRPWGVCCDNNGHVIIADRSNNRIQIFRSDGSHVKAFGRQGSEEGEFNRPAGVAIDFYGRIVVTDKDNHRVQVFTMDGTFVFEFGERGQSNGKFHYPWDVDVNSAGLIAVSDTRNHRIQLFSGNGIFLKKFGFENMSNMWKFFDSPRGLCFTPDNTIMCTDFNNHRLYEIDIEKTPKLLNADNYKRCELFRPQGLAMDNEGNVLVADCRNNRIQVFTRHGDIIGSFGVAGKELGQFDRPSGIALTPDGKIVVVDFGNHRIQLF